VELQVHQELREQTEHQVLQELRDLDSIG
jgi:hypothetical protein